MLSVFGPLYRVHHHIRSHVLLPTYTVSARHSFARPRLAPARWACTHPRRKPQPMQRPPNRPPNPPNRMRSLTFAGSATPPAAEPDEHTRALVEELGSQVDQLRHALVVATEEYQVSEPVVFGGTTGNYALQNIYSTPAQFRVCCCAFTGAGTAVLSTDQGMKAPAATGVIQPGARQPGTVFASAGADTKPGYQEWADISGDTRLYLDVSVTTDSAFVTVQFRRRVNRAGVFAEGHA